MTITTRITTTMTITSKRRGFWYEPLGLGALGFARGFRGFGSSPRIPESLSPYGAARSLR
jgi:hypothetical protein